MNQKFRAAWRMRGYEEDWIRSMVVGTSINICSGYSNLGDVKLDLFENSNIRASYNNLPLRELSFDTVIFDPPFNIWASLKRTYKILGDLMRIARRRVFVIGLGMYFVPFFKAFWASLYWKRYRRNWVRFIVIYDRINDGILKALSETI